MQKLNCNGQECLLHPTFHSAVGRLKKGFGFGDGVAASLWIGFGRAASADFSAGSLSLRLFRLGYMKPDSSPLCFDTGVEEEVLASRLACDLLPPLAELVGSSVTLELLLLCCLTNGLDCSMLVGSAVMFLVFDCSLSLLQGLSSMHLHLME